MPFNLDLTHPLSNGLVFAGLGNNPRTIKYLDSSLKGNHGTLTNMDPPTDWVWSPELNRYVLDFNGSSQGVHGPVQRSANAVQSLSVWARPSSLPATVRFLLTIGASTRVTALRVSGMKKLTGYTYESDGGLALREGNTVWSVDKWYHCAMTVAFGAVNIYLNGTADGAPVSWDGTVSADTVYSIGRVDTSDNTYEWIGNIADPCYWNRALSLAEIQLLATRDPFYGGWIVPELSSKRYYIFDFPSSSSQTKYIWLKSNIINKTIYGLKLNTQ